MIKHASVSFHSLRLTQHQSQKRCVPTYRLLSKRTELVAPSALAAPSQSGSSQLRCPASYLTRSLRDNSGCDAETSEILAHVLTDPDVGDITAVPSQLATVEGPIANAIADGAYDGASVYKATFLRQRDPPLAIVIPPRASSMASTHDTNTSTTRDRHVQDIAESGRMAWQKDTGYGRRSLVEAAIGRYKRGIGPKLRARSFGG
ncbi:hypothetical protein HN018_26210 (plasmid) [Lichenicola cladoniae]|uniref:Transposase IS4-like domain-containing protein n=1 Tax=Lichenicola cladoniae TaxID=1484109 RepID=A0A6M8HZK6_9PROT|nr:transposase [Lichenicola cladoniae]NPD67643.1 hypothetical protein [Acetobacteraceae bacterium]QKE93647.1 hypothetical protein HN018_26210 [Lichenicola cladoniae]